jgi:hypothetical protein
MLERQTQFWVRVPIYNLEAELSKELSQLKEILRKTFFLILYFSSWIKVTTVAFVTNIVHVVYVLTVDDHHLVYFHFFFIHILKNGID